MAKKVVKVIAGAGHGGGGVTPGKRSPAGEYEWDFNDRVADGFEDELRKYQGVEVRRVDDDDTSDGYEDVPLQQRVKEAEEWGADYWISFHHNAYNGKWGNHTGTETYCWFGHPESEELAKIVHNAMVEVYGLHDRGVKEGNWLYIVRKSTMPTVLTEGGFMDSVIDIQVMRDEATLYKAGQNVARKFAEWKGLKRKSSNEQKKDTPNKRKPVSKEAFLAFIEKGAIEGWKKYGILPSISGAQAILESAWGTSELALVAHNLFGIKAGKDWKGATYQKKTKEQDKAGKERTVTATFRMYDSWADSVADHGSFFTSTEWRKKNYAKVIGETDYRKQAQALQDAGYATDKQYAKKLIQLIETNGLEEWDKAVLPKPKEPAYTYVVEKGDTLWGIAKEHGVTVDALKQANGLTSDLIHPNQVLSIPSSKKPAPKKIYTVKKGDTLWGIAKAHGITVDALKQANGLTSDLIHPNNKLVIPSKKSQPAPKPSQPSYIGRRVESKVDGLRFYRRPSWEDQDVAGYLKKGYGFPTIVEKIKVREGYQYKVKNSKGAVYYVTASDVYVRVE